MSHSSHTSRRNFLKSGSIAAAPLAVAAMPAAAAAAATDDSAARLARLEDERAIERLNQDFLRHFNAQGGSVPTRLLASDAQSDVGEQVTRLFFDHGAEADTLELSEDGLRAQGHFACEAEDACPLEGEETFAQMARFQGNMGGRSNRQATLELSYAKGPDGWRIEKLVLS